MTIMGLQKQGRILLSLTLAVIIISCTSGVHLNSNGGYEDIVVTIGKEVPPIACQQIIQNIQAIFTSASEYLREATDGRVYFHRITIVVPPMWDTRACGRSLPANSFTSRSSVNDATIRIGTEHPIFGHLPWTQQSRSCGLPGDFISVGYHYILQFNETGNGLNHNGQSVNNNLSSQRESDHWSSGNFNGQNGDSNFAGFDFRAVPAERAFVHEWAKFRYGVFEEIGFPNDPIYPSFYTDSRSGEKKPTACTNHPINGNWSSGCDSSNNYGYLFNNNNRNASSSSAPGSSPTSPSCVFTPDTSSSSYENDRITSSIMSFPQGRNVRAFCDSTTHNARAPTKQNFLCDRKSTSEIIFEHPDFQHLPTREPNVPVPAPEFIVKQITQPRFVLLVEETGNMNLRDVWKFLKLAVRKFIKYDLAAGTQIGLITVSSNDVRVLANMTALKSLTVRRALADKLANYPNVDGGGNIALRRGVFQAVDLLKRNQQKAAGSVIILISQGTVSSMDLETSLELLREEEVSLASIEYPSLSDGKIAQLAEGTNGPHFTIRETGVGPMTHLSTYIHLINALMSIQKFYTEDVAASWPIMIHQTEYRGDLRSYIESNFSFESNAIQTQGEFFIYTSNPNDPKINSVELTSPNGVKYTTQLSDLHDINVIKIDAVINEPGVWRYRIERLADSHQSHFVQVVTKTTSEDLYVRLYTNIPVNKVANLTSTPLVLYTEVKRKNSPVIDADVEALIVAGNKKWTVKLLDNGNGDPDVTRSDGVYSRYFIVPPGVTTSQLEISSKVIVNPYRAKFAVVSQDPLYQTGTSSSTSSSNNNSLLPCCGSFVAPADPRQQYKIVPFGERSSNSLVVRISDVPSLGSYPPGRIGDLRVDSIDGQDRSASLRWTAPGEDYDQGIVASYQIFYSLDSFNEDWKLLTEFTADIEAGVEDNATINLPYYGSFLITMSVIDFYGKSSKASNIVPLSVFQPPREPDPTQSPSHANTLGITNTTPPSTEELTKLDLILIIICAVVFILLLSGLIVLLLYCRKLGSSNRKSVKAANEAKIAAIADPKSPIHWSASELLGEHEKRHSMYDGSVVPENGSANSDSSKQRHPHYHVNHGLQNGSGPQHSMHLNIVSPSQEYNGVMVGGSSPSHRASSPDSYDDPECPTPIPVSVRNRHPPIEYGICNEQSSSSQTNCSSNNSVIMSNNPSMMNRSMNYPQEPPPQYHHYQMPQNNSVVYQPQHHQYPNYQQHVLENSHPHRFSINSELSSSSRISQNFKNIKVPPPPLPPSQQQTLLLPLSHNPHHLNQHQGLISRSTSTTSSGGGPPHQQQQHLMHYDPDIQGSMTSVNSKKKNITMV